MTSRLIVNSIRHTGASADAITLDNSGNATFPANVTCSGTASGFGGGKLLQQVHVSYATQTSVSSTSYTDSGLTASITPSSSSSKILVMISQSWRMNRSAADMAGAIKIVREQSGTETDVSNTNSDLLWYVLSGTTAIYVHGVFTQIVEDSPNTTSAVNYKTKQRVYSNGTITTQRSTSYITLQEIGA